MIAAAQTTVIRTLFIRNAMTAVAIPTSVFSTGGATVSVPAAQLHLMRIVQLVLQQGRDALQHPGPCEEEDDKGRYVRKLSQPAILLKSNMS